MITLHVYGWLYAIAGLTGLVASLLLTPVIRRLALATRCVDLPDDHRKLHGRVIPVGGGGAVLLAFFAATGFVFACADTRQPVFAGTTEFLFWLVLSTITIATVGLWDDRFGLRGRQKLLGQFAAATLLLPSGLAIRQIEIFDYSIELGLLSIPFTYFWLLGAINALNLIDGMDGLATAVGVLLSSAIAGVAILTGHVSESFLAIAFAGSLIGFWCFNRPPATIFLGDSGSMLIGLVLGALAIRGSLKGPATVALAAPTAIWAIPLFDVTMAILRRRLTGRSIYTTDRGHLHHVLARRGFGGLATVTFIALLCLLTGLGALASVYAKNESLAYGMMFLVFALLIAFRMFGHLESQMLIERLTHFTKTLLPALRGSPPPSRLVWTRLQGNRQWEEVWLSLTQFAERFDLHRIQLNVNLPAIEEEYHATWERKSRSDRGLLWHSEIPLILRDRSVGRLLITGSCRGGRVCSWLADLICELKPLESRLYQMLDEHHREQLQGGASDVPVPTFNDLSPIRPASSIT